MIADIIIPFSIIACCLMAWAVGANDLANSMGSSVGAKSISIRTAVILAAIFEGAGALLASGNVTSTLKEELFHVALWDAIPMELAIGMLSALIASVIWLIIATHKAWPVSTTHTVVGAIIGFTLVVLGIEGIRWDTIISILMSWALTPLVGGIISYVLFKAVQSLVFDAPSPLHEARIWLPLCACSMGCLVVSMTVWGCLPKMGVIFNNYQAIITLIISLLSIFYISSAWIKSLTKKYKVLNYSDQIREVEKGFGALTVFTACAMAFSHGGNDISNALGPVAAIMDIVEYGHIVEDRVIPYSLVILGASCVILGLATYGYRIMQTVGSHITQLTPSRAFAAEFSTTLVVMAATVWGFPVSTTQTLVGSILGVGMARGVGAINIETVRNIFVSWAFTLPVGAATSSVIFIILKHILL